jgi:hypothetical protein
VGIEALGITIIREVGIWRTLRHESNRKMSIIDGRFVGHLVY